MIVRAGTLYDGTLDPPKTNVDLYLDGATITGIAAASEAEPDLAAACVVPGLVNAHAHLEMSGEADTMGAFRTLSPQQRMLRAVANARESLLAGVTTVRDLGSSNRIAPDLREAVNEGRIPGPRMSTAGAALCMTGGHGWFVGRPIDGPWEARKAVREQLQAGADCIKLIATGGVLTKGAVPGIAQLLPEELTAAIAEAHHHGLRCAAHAIGTAGIKNALRAGIDSIEHGYLIDDECLQLLLERKAYIVPTLTAPQCILEHAGDDNQPEWVTRKAASVTETLSANFQRAYRAGVRFAGGSDAGTPFNYHRDYARELEAMQHIIGMTPQQALHAATALAADLVGITRGVLARGEPADLLLLDGDIGSDARPLRRPQAVLKDGIAVFERGRPAVSAGTR